MKKILKVMSIIFLIPVLIIIGLILFSRFSDNMRIILPLKHKAIYQNENISKFPSLLHSAGNKILNSADKPILFRGLMAPDPQRLDFENRFKKSYYADIAKTGANVLRVPVHPDRWIADKDYLWRHLDPIVTWAGSSNMYVIIDWHYIGNIATGEGNEMPDIKERPIDLTMKFWKQTAAYFKNTPNVIFEIYNEPSEINMDTWYQSANDIIKTIRNTGAKQLIIVGGIDYSYDLSWVETKPILDKNIAYASHVYPNRSNWDLYFGNTASKFPVIITEWGFMDENRTDTKQPYLIGNEDSFGKPLLEYLKNKNIGWVACWYDNNWEPPMFKKNYKDYTHFGKFVFDQLKNK